jgi:regulatory protein
MRTITEIREAKGRQGLDRYEVHFDDASNVVLSAREISDLHLHEGDRVSDDLHSRAVVAGRRLAAFDRAVGMLARGPRSMFDLRRKLVAKGEDRDAVRWALAKLESTGVTSDESFALQFARSRLARGASRAAVLSGLLKVAVARDTAEQAITRVIGEEEWDEKEASTAAVAKKMRSLTGIDHAVAKRRLIGFLRRRGYNATVIRDAVAKLNAEKFNAR